VNHVPHIASSAEFFSSLLEAVPTLSKARVMARVAGDSWLETGDNLLVFGPPDLAS
jgi:hypothetical protein